MFEKKPTYLNQRDENFELALEGMQRLRKQFLEMPFSEFVNISRISESLSDNESLLHYLISFHTRLDFGTDSFRYFMSYLQDEKTAEVIDSRESHNIHTDFRGRCEIRHVDGALAYAMGFTCLEEELEVEKWGYEADPGYVEESISTALGEVQISGHKNTNGNYHGYCQILQSDGAYQECFFDDGKILARRIYYANEMSEDIRSCDTLAIDPFADRYVYAFSEGSDAVEDVEKIAIDRETAEELYHILENYTLYMRYSHEVEYPYDDEKHTVTERDHCVPCLNMALLRNGTLWGVILKTNRYNILPLDDDMYSRSRRWKNHVIALDEELSEGDLMLSLRKKGT